MAIFYTKENTTPLRAEPPSLKSFAKTGKIFTTTYYPVTDMLQEMLFWINQYR